MKESLLPPPIEGLEALYEEARIYHAFYGLDHAFTRHQNKAIKDRDNHTCQFPEEGGHGGRLHVHHLIPKSLEDKTGIDVDHPLNGITICENHHEKIHDKYGNGNGKAYKTNRGAVIWDEEWDSDLAGKAVDNTRKAIRKGWRYPDD